MRTISLTKGKETLVSDKDYANLMQWKWYFKLASNGKFGYAVRSNGPRRARKMIYMHKIVAIWKGLFGEVDHRDGNKLNNQRGNLRMATHRQNVTNSSLHVDNKSGYKGVSWRKRSLAWVAYIGVDGEHKYLGSFPPTKAGKIAAAREYNKAAKRYFGKFAVLNRVP